MATILERVTKVTATRLGAKEDAVEPSSNFTDDLGADSLDQVELIMGLEEEFSTPEKPVKIPDEDAAKIKTVQDAVDYVKNKGIKDADGGMAVAQTTPLAKSAEVSSKSPAGVSQPVGSQKQTTANASGKTAAKDLKPAKKSKSR